MSQEYMWFDIDAKKKLGKKQLRVLNQSYIESTIGNYLLNPLNRKIINDVPSMIENIEQNTIRHTLSDNDDKWDGDKMGDFVTMLEQSYTNIMNDPLESLIDLYIPSIENAGDKPKKGTYWEKLADFKGEKHFKNPDTDVHELIEGTGLPKQLKLKELFEVKEVANFTGDQVSMGKGTESKLQKDLVKERRKYTSNEFFGRKPRHDNVMSHISVEYLDAEQPYESHSDKDPTPKNYGTIQVKLTIDHTQGDISKAIFEKAGLTKWSLEDDPTSYGGSIREGNYSQGWAYKGSRPDTGSFVGSGKNKTWATDSIWWGNSKIKEAQREKYEEYLAGNWTKFKQQTVQRFTGLKGGIEDINDKLKEVQEKIKTVKPNTKEEYGVKLPIMDDPTYERHKPLGEITEEQPDLSPRQKDKVDWKEKLKPRAGSIKPKGDREKGEEVPTTKAGLLDEVEDLEEFIDWIKMAHPRVFNNEETFKEALDKTEAADSAPTEQHKIDMRQGVEDAVGNWDKSYQIKLDASEMAQLKEDFIKAYTPIISDKEDLGDKSEDTNSIRELFNGMIIDDSRLYKYLLKRKVGIFSPWELRKVVITFRLKWEHLKDNMLLLESDGKVTSNKRVSKSIITKPAQIKSKGQRKHIVRPYTRRAGGHAQKAGMGGPESITEKQGRNSIRARFVKKFKSYNARLKEAASKIGANLQV